MKAAVLGTLATETFLLFLGIATGSLAARLLLPDGRGALAAVIFWPQLLAGIGLLSLNQASTYRIGAAHERGRVATATAVWISMLLAGLTTIVGYGLIPFLLGEGREQFAALARTYLLAFVPFNFMTMVLLAEDQGRLRFARYNGLRLLVPFTYLLGLFGLWVCDAISVATVAAANCGATVLAAVVRMTSHGTALLARPSIEESVALLHFALRFHPATLLTFLTAQADRFAVLMIWDDAAVGQYVVALAVASAGLSVAASTFNRVLFPSLARAADAQAQASLLGRGVRYASLFLFVLSVPLVVTLPWIVPVLFGPEYRDAVMPALILVGAYFLAALRAIIVQGLLGFGEGRPGVVAEGIALALFLIAVGPVGASLGLVGVGLALGLANGVSLGYLAIRLQRRYGLGARALWGVTPSTVAEVWRHVGRPRLMAGATE